jgi:hypothetical protein
MAITRLAPFEYSNRWPEIGPQMGLSAETIRLLDDRDRQLEDYLSMTPIIFDHDAGTEKLRSKPWTAKTFHQVRGWYIELDQEDDGTDVVAVGALDFELHVDGAVQATLTIPSGETYAEYTGRMPTIPARGRMTILDTGDGVDYNYVSTVWV